MISIGYLPAALAFAFALLSMLTRTTDSTQVGLRRITRAGWLFVVLSAVSFVLGLIAIHSSHVTAQKRQIVANMARVWIADSIATLLRPLCGETMESGLQPSALFAHLAERNLRLVGQDRAVKWIPEGRIVARATIFTPATAFDEPFEVYDRYISAGQQFATQTLGLFGQYFSEEEIIATSTLLADPFLNLDYSLTPFLDYLEDRSGLPTEVRGRNLLPACCSASIGRKH